MRFAGIHRGVDASSEDPAFRYPYKRCQIPQCNIRVLLAFKISCLLRLGYTLRNVGALRFRQYKTMSDETGSFSCPICHNTYGRVEHLQRHLSSHSVVRPFYCQLCGKSYRRRDVLARHRLACEAKTAADRQKGPVSRRQSTRRACDRCVIQKRACSCTNPCHNCAAQNHECTYPPQVQNRARPKQVPEPAEEEMPSSLDWIMGQLEELPMLQTTSCASSLEVENIDSVMTAFEVDLEQFSFWVDRDPAYQFSFLNQFAKNEGLAKTFGCLDIIQTTQLTCINQSLLDTNLSENVYATKDLSNSFAFDSTMLDWTPWDSTLNGGTPILTNYEDPLISKTIEICGGMKRVLESKSDNGIVAMDWSESTDGLSRQFFSPQNLRKFMEYYWISWHPHWPCIHKPSFNFFSTPAPLLAGLVIIGAILSPRVSDRQNARLWFNALEAWAFDEEHESGLMTGRTSYTNLGSDKWYGKLQRIQAAFVVAMLQVWEGGDIGRCRIRRSRLTSIVTVGVVEPLIVCDR